MAYKKSTKKNVMSSFPKVSALKRKQVKELLKKYRTAKKEETVAKLAMKVQDVLRKLNNRSIKLTKKEANLINEINQIMKIRCVTRWAALLKRRANKNFKNSC